MLNQCTIDLIVEKKVPAHIVYEDEEFIAFLDIHPVFFGHILLAPKRHYPTLYDIPPPLSASMIALTQKIGAALELGMNAEGSFIAMNNRVSQSIPHLHIHIIPRNKHDGLRGFFWPRKKYDSEEHMIRVCDQISHHL